MYVIEHLCCVQTAPAEAGPDQAGGGKEALLPAELLATVETLKNTIKEEKSLSSEVGQPYGNFNIAIVALCSPDILLDLTALSCIR